MPEEDGDKSGSSDGKVMIIAIGTLALIWVLAVLIWL